MRKFLLSASIVWASLWIDCHRKTSWLICQHFFLQFWMLLKTTAHMSARLNPLPLCSTDFFFVLQMSSLIRHYLFGHLFLLHFVSSNLPVAKGHRNKGVNYAIKEHNIYELDSALTYKFVNWSLCSFIERFTVRKTLTELWWQNIYLVLNPPVVPVSTGKSWWALCTPRAWMPLHDTGAWAGRTSQLRHSTSRCGLERWADKATGRIAVGRSGWWPEGGVTACSSVRLIMDSVSILLKCLHINDVYYC